MKSFLPATIKGFVTVIVVAALLPALGLMLYSAFSAARAELKAADLAALRIVNSLALRYARHLEDSRRQLLTLSLLEEIRKPDLERAAELFRSTVQYSDAYVDIRLCDTRGHTLVSGADDPGPLSPSERAQVAKAASSPGFKVQELSFAAAGSSIIHCTMPVRSEGGKRTVLVAALRVDIPGHIRAAIEANAGFTLRVTDRNGRVVTGYPSLSGEQAEPAPQSDTVWTAVSAERGAFGVLHLPGNFSTAYEKLRDRENKELNLAALLTFSGEGVFESREDEVFLRIALLLGAAILSLLIAWRLSYISLIAPVQRLLDTARRLKEGDLEARVANVPMARELRVLADSLNSMAGALRDRKEELIAARDGANAFNQAKTDFLATMSHEIRTPMNAILGMAYLARQSVLTVQQRTYLAAISTEAEKLLAIINDILNFSKIEAGRFPVESVPFALNNVLEDVAARSLAEARKKGLAFSMRQAPDMPLYLRGDPMLLSQVLGNIVGNAVKFTEQGEVRLDCFVERTTPPDLFLVCDVHDTAGGMNSLERDLLFPEEEPEDKIATFDAGIGLNLSVTRKLTRLMRGAFSVKTEQGVGSTVTIRLPFTESSPLTVEDGERDGDEKEALPVPQGPEPAAEGPAGGETDPPGFGQDAPASAPQEDSLKNVRILFVEDNPINQQLGLELLTAAGAQVHSASNGQEALNMLEDMSKGYPYQVVLMDLQMPVLDGFAATRRIRMDDRFKNLPIIAMTAHDPRDEWARCKDVGMNDYIAKPLDVPALMATVSRWAQRAGQRETAER